MAGLSYRLCRSKSRCCGLLLLLVAIAAAVPSASAAGRSLVGNDSLPSSIELPNGFFPEGIVAGRYPTFYVASIVTGKIYAGDFTHPSRGRVLLQLPYAKGLSYDAAAHVLYVAGIDGGAYAVDLGARPLRSGVVHLRLPFYPSVGRSSINDAEVAPGIGAFFTDSLSPRLLRVRPWPSTETEWVTMDGFEMDDRANATNANGLLYLPGGSAGAFPAGGCPWASAPTLLVGSFALGQLYELRLPATGAPRVHRLDVRCGLPDEQSCTLAGENGNPPVVMGGVDGMVRHPATPRDVYIANPTRGSITVVRLDRRCRGGRPTAAVVGVIRNDALRGPTTLATAGGWLYALNSRLPEVPPGGGLADLASGGFDDWDFNVIRFGRLGGP